MFPGSSDGANWLHVLAFHCMCQRRGPRLIEQSCCDNLMSRCFCLQGISLTLLS